MAWMVPAIAWVMGAWREVRIVPALDGAGTSCPAMSVAGLSRRYRVMPGGIRWVAGRLYLGGWSPLCTGAGRLSGRLGRGAQGRPAASGEGADDGGCRMFLRVLLLLRRSRGRVPWVRGGRDPDGRAGVRRHRARPAGAAQPCSERARARRAGDDLAGMGGADPGSPSRHRDERQHVPGRDRPGEPTLAGEQSRLAQNPHPGAAHRPDRRIRIVRRRSASTTERDRLEGWLHGSGCRLVGRFTAGC